MTKYLTFITVVFFISCNNTPNQKVISPNQNGITSSKSDSIDQQIDTSEAEIQYRKSESIFNTTKPQKFNIASNKVSNIVGTKGLKITIDPQNLETKNGAALGSSIELELKEMTNQKDLFLNDAPTISDGKLLVSGGAYYIAMKSDGNELRIKEGKSVTIQISKLSKNEMELFYGERNEKGDLNWVAANKKIENLVESNKIERMISIANVPIKEIKNKERPAISIESNGMSLMALSDSAKKRNNRVSFAEFKKWDSIAKTTKIIPKENVKENYESGDYSQRIIKQKDSVTGKILTKSEISYYLPTEIINLGFINCDRFLNNKLDGQIECEFDSSININEASLYVIFKNINSLIKENISNNGVSNITKLKTKLPIGETVKLLALTKKGNMYFSYKSEFVISGTQKVILKFSPETAVDATTIVY